MNTNEARKEVVVKTVGDIVLVAVYVGLAVIEIKAYHKLDFKSLGKAGEIVASTVIWTAAGSNVWKAYTKICGIVSNLKDYRNKNLENRQSEIEEFVKNYTQDEAYMKQMGDLFKAAVAEA